MSSVKNLALRVLERRHPKVKRFLLQRDVPKESSHQPMGMLLDFTSFGPLSVKCRTAWRVGVQARAYQDSQKTLAKPSFKACGTGMMPSGVNFVCDAVASHPFCSNNISFAN